MGGTYFNSLKTLVFVFSIVCTVSARHVPFFNSGPVNPHASNIKFSGGSNLLDHTIGGPPGAGDDNFPGGVGKRWSMNLFDDTNSGLPGIGDDTLVGAWGKRWNMNLFDDSNGGLPDAGNDHFPSGPGKRWNMNLFDDSNGGLPDAGNDVFSGGLGKRCVNLFNGGCGYGSSVDAVQDEFPPGDVGKRWSMNLFDDSNGGLPGAGNDHFTGGVDKRWNMNLFDHSNGELPGADADIELPMPGKRNLRKSGHPKPGTRCVNFMNGGCGYGSLPGASDDYFPPDGVGKRWSMNLFDDSNGGLPGAGNDHFAGGVGKRWNMNLFDDSNGGLPGAGNDHFVNGVGKRWNTNLFDHSNGELPGADADIELPMPGKRNIRKSGHPKPGTKCVNLMNGGCAYGGTIGTADDTFSGLGKRHVPQNWFRADGEDITTSSDVESGLSKSDA